MWQVETCGLNWYAGNFGRLQKNRIFITCTYLTKRTQKEQVLHSALYNLLRWKKHLKKSLSVSLDSKA